MYLGMAIAGLFVGIMAGAAGGELLGAASGAVVGVLFAHVSKLRTDISRMDHRLARLSVLMPSDRTVRKPVVSKPPVTAPEPVREPQPVREPRPVREPIDLERRDKTASRHMPTENAFDRFVSGIIGWITRGNVPVKVGVVVSFIGIAFLLKYAVQNGLISVSLEYRFIAAAVAGILLIATGLRLRIRMRSYALTLQGGGIAIVYLTIYSAMRLYGLLEPGTAILLSVVLSGLTGVLAVSQDSRTLAVFGIVGGFVAPLLAPVADANHVVLFTYYLTLNAAILGIAWFRSWRELNVLGLVLTFVIGGLWGINKYDATLFVSTETFLILHFVLYQAVAVLFATRQPTNLKGIVDGTLLLALPVLAFAIQAQLVGHIKFGLAYSAIALAVAYALTALALRFSGYLHFRLLTEVFCALAIAFGTLSLPLALDARWTTASWALEGAALVWLGMRQTHLLARYSGSALLIAAGISFAAFGWETRPDTLIVNANVVGGVLVAISSLIAANLLRRDKGNDIHADQAQNMSLGLLVWSLLWWFGTGIVEISRQVGDDYRLIAIGLLLTGTAVLLTEIAARLKWHEAAAATTLFLPAMVLTGTAIVLGGDRLTDHGGWFLWPVAIATQFVSLHRLNDLNDKAMDFLHAGSLLAIAALLATESYLQVSDLGAAEIWPMIMLIAVPCLFVILLVRLRDSDSWPIGAYRSAYVETSAGLLVGFQLLIMTLLNLSSSGDPSPLPYLPLLNPLAIATVVSLLTLLYWSRNVSAMRDDAKDRLWSNARKTVLALVVVVTTMSLLRGAHHLGGIPWNAERLFDSTFVQATLSIYWSILGVVGMVWGASSGQRKVWIAGTALMSIVVAKLFLVDLSGVGTLSRIVSFVGVGSLLLLVGYFAPVPPREDTI